MSTKAVAAGAAMVIMMLAPVVIAEEDVTGEWDFKNQMPARDVQAFMTITRNEEGKLAGTLLVPFIESELSDITFENGTLKFAQTYNSDGREVKVMYEGKVEGTNITGRTYGRFGELPLEGTLQGQPQSDADAVIGKWHIIISIPAIDAVDKFIITKNGDGTLAGKWTGRIGEHTITNLKFEGGRMTFIREIKIGVLKFESRFTGVVDSDQIVGIFSNEQGDRAANATRVSSGNPKE